MLKTEANAYDLKTFCKRNGIGVSTAYKAAREGRLELKKMFGKVLVTAEAERAFLADLPAWAPAAPTDHRRENGRKLGDRRRLAKAGAAA